MSKVEIEKKICIEPNFLNEKLLSNIYEKLLEKYINRCSKHNGYILKIYPGVQILNNVVSNVNSSVYFNVKFKARCLKPEIDSEHECKVCMVFVNGLFAEVKGVLKIFIPNDRMKKYKFQGTKYTYKDNTIEVDSIITARLNMIKYEKHNFNCIGTLI